MSLRRLPIYTLIVTIMLINVQCIKAQGTDEKDNVTESIGNSEAASTNETILAPTLMLNNGHKMSAFGIGTYSLKNGKCYNSIYIQP